MIKSKMLSKNLMNIVPFVSMLFFMMGTVYVATDEFYEYKYLRLLNIIPVLIAIIMPYCINNMKSYPKIIYGILSILSLCEMKEPSISLSLPYANSVFINEVFGIHQHNVGTIINALFVFVVFVCSLWNKKSTKISSWMLIALNMSSVIFVLIIEPLWINLCDYCFSVSYMLLILTAIISVDLCESDNKKMLENFPILFMEEVKKPSYSSHFEEADNE